MYCFEAFHCGRTNCPVRLEKVRCCWEYFEKNGIDGSKESCPHGPCSLCHYRMGWEIGLITDEIFSDHKIQEPEALLPISNKTNTEGPPLLGKDAPCSKEAIEGQIEGKKLGQAGMRFCWEVMPCPNPRCPVREQKIVRCFKFFEPRGDAEKLKITGGTRVCSDCFYKRGWDIGVIEESLFEDVFAEKRRRMAKLEHIRTNNIVEIYLNELAKKPLSKQEEIELAKRLAGDKKAAELFLLANLKLVVRIASSFSNRGLALMDLIQEGNIGLIKAISKFDYTLGYKFSTYAAYWVRHYMQKAISDQARTIRIPHHLLVIAHKIKKTVAELSQTFLRTPTLAEISEVLMLDEEKILDILQMTQTPISIEAKVSNEGGDDENTDYYLEDKKSLSPEELALESAKVEACKKIIDLLPVRLKEIVELFYGFREETVSLAEIGRRMGISRERARQLLVQALKTLEGHEFTASLKDFLAK
ncbi:RNA polymerase sigma factor RpoD/SigA [bacterium]|nr:RNA polymerase sigma factor RpoD/SigA [bacterium]